MRIRLFFLQFLLLTFSAHAHESVNPEVTFKGFGRLSIEKARFGERVRELLVFEKGGVAIVDDHLFINRDYFGRFKKADVVNEGGVIKINGKVAKPIKLSEKIAIECFGVLNDRTSKVTLPDGVQIVVDGSARREPDASWRAYALRPLEEGEDLLLHCEDILIEKDKNFWIVCSKWKIPISSKSIWEIVYSKEAGRFILKAL